MACHPCGGNVRGVFAHKAMALLEVGQRGVCEAFCPE